MEKRTVVKKSFNRVKKSGIIVIGVSLVYYIYDCKKISLEFNIVVFVKRVIEGPMSNCLWYMYIGILLILPVLQKMTKPMKKQDYMYMLVSGFFLLSVCPVIAHWLDESGISNLITDSMLSVYVLMVVLGYYLEKYVDLKNGCIKWLLLIIGSETCINVGIY